MCFFYAFSLYLSKKLMQFLLKMTRNVYFYHLKNHTVETINPSPRTSLASVTITKAFSSTS